MDLRKRSKDTGLLKYFYGGGEKRPRPRRAPILVFEYKYMNLGFQSLISLIGSFSLLISWRPSYQSSRSAPSPPTAVAHLPLPNSGGDGSQARACLPLHHSGGGASASHSPISVVAAPLPSSSSDGGQPKERGRRIWPPLSSTMLGGGGNQRSGGGGSDHH